MINQENIRDSQFSTSDITWTNLLGEISSDEKFDQSLEEINRLLDDVVQSSDNIIVEITDDKRTITLPDETQSLSIIENTTQPTSITSQVISNYVILKIHRIFMCFPIIRLMIPCKYPLMILNQIQ